MEIVVLSANLRTDRVSPDTLGVLLDEEAPDVAALQELGPRAVGEVRSRYEHSLLLPRKDARGIGIAARRKVDFEVDLVDGLVIGTAILDPADWPALYEPLGVTTLHVLSPLVRPLLQTSRTRRRQVDRVLELAASPPAAQLFVGDFNATPLWRTYRRLARTMEDLALSEGSRPRRTWGPTAGAPRLLRIDHAFGIGVTARTVRVERVHGSDHNAVIVQVAVDERPGDSA